MLGMDRSVFLAVAARLWGSCAGLITTILVGTFFSAAMQGYYYTFSSVLAFQVFAELGLSGVLIYYASHEWGQLALDRQGRLTGDGDARSRLVSLGRFAFKWYAITAAVFTVAVAI